MRIAVLVALACTLVLGCRAKPTASDSGVPASSASGDTKVSAPAAVPSAVPTQVPALAQLKPILDKPFPDGASEAVVCEAIDNTQEKDLWVRFGHIVPVYTYGALYVLEAFPQQIEQVRQNMKSYNGGLYWPSIKACRADRALLYVRSLSEDASRDGRSWGREHLGKRLQAEAGVKILESYAIPNDQEQLSNYCRADADLCESLVKLDYENRGEGLCARAMSACDQMEDSGAYPLILERCRRTARSELACLKYDRSARTSAACERRVRAAVCP